MNNHHVENKQLQKHLIIPSEHVLFVLFSFFFFLLPFFNILISVLQLLSVRVGKTQSKLPRGKRRDVEKKLCNLRQSIKK